MTQQTINIGTTANDGTGDDLRTAMQKVNLNFTELYGASPLTSSISIEGNHIYVNDSNANLKLSASGTGAIELEGIQIRDNRIEATRSNDDLVLSAAGSGDIVVGAVRIHGTTISSDDSTKITFNEAVDVTGTLTAGTIDVNVLQSTDSTAIQINEGLNVSGTLSANTIDTNNISSGDSSILQINDGVLVTGSLQVNGSLGFFGTTPVAQQSAIAFDPMANDGSTVDDLRQIINQMLVVMRNYGLIAS
jgi:hypothetical protein